MASNVENQMLNRVDRIEKDLSQLVSLLAEETGNRRVFEERMSNAIVEISKANTLMCDLQQKQHNMELFLAKDVATIADRQKLHLRIDAIEDGQKKNTWILSGGVHLIWLFVATLLSFLGYTLRGHS